MSKLILGTNKEGLKEIQKRNGYTVLGFIGMIGLICLFNGLFVGLIFLAGSGLGIYLINKYFK